VSWYQDLGTQSMMAEGAYVRAVGWLSIRYPFPTGSVPPEFLRRLFKFVDRSRESEKVLGWPQLSMAGHHVCELCPETSEGYFIGYRNFGVPSGGLLYVAPELIKHYVVDHAYRPPAEFIAALMVCPIPGTKEYRRLASPFVDLAAKTFAEYMARDDI